MRILKAENFVSCLRITLKLVSAGHSVLQNFLTPPPPHTFGLFLAGKCPFIINDDNLARSCRVKLIYDERYLQTTYETIRQSIDHAYEPNVQVIQVRWSKTNTFHYPLRK